MHNQFVPLSQVQPGKEFLLSSGKKGVVVRHGSGSSLVRYPSEGQHVSFTQIGGRTVQFDRPGKAVPASLNSLVRPL